MPIQAYDLVRLLSICGYGAYNIQQSDPHMSQEQPTKVYKVTGVGVAGHFGRIQHWICLPSVGHEIAGLRSVPDSAGI